MLRTGMLGLPKLSNARVSYLQDSTLFLTGPLNCNTMKNSVSFLHKYEACSETIETDAI